VSPLFLLLDARADPVSPVPWGALILLLAIVFVLAVGLVAGLVALLIWYKRRKTKEAAVSS
jgi:flagellin-like protein